MLLTNVLTLVLLVVLLCVAPMVPAMFTTRVLSNGLRQERAARAADRH